MRFLRYLLLPFSLIYGLITFIRNKLFDWKILRSRKFDIPTISVGNLSTGGTGKSPHIEYLVRLLKDKFQVATLSRGYGRESRGYKILPKEPTSKEAGDEPKQFKMKYNDITVAVCEKRIRGVTNILKDKPGTDVVLLDDAFQHRYINPGLSIILTDFHKIFTKNYVLPTGSLREFSRGSKRADIVVVSKSPKVLSPLEKRRIQEEIKVYPHQKLYFSFIKYGPLTPLPFINLKPSLEKISVIILFTGIANPSPLEEHLKLKCDELKIFKFPDHHKFKTKDLKKIRHEYKETFQKYKIIVTTEKDLMRLENPEHQKLLSDIPAFYIPIEVKFHKSESGASFDDYILEYMNKNIKST